MLFHAAVSGSEAADFAHRRGRRVLNRISLGARSMALSVPEALRWAPIESMHVVQYFGAQTGLLTKPELLKFLQRARKATGRNSYKELSVMECCHDGVVN